MTDLYLGPGCRAALPGDAEAIATGIWMRPSPLWEHRLVVAGCWRALVIGEPGAMSADWEGLLDAYGRGEGLALSRIPGVHSGIFWREGHSAQGWWRDRFGRIPWQHRCAPDFAASTDPDLMSVLSGADGLNLLRIGDFLAGGQANDRADFALNVERLRPGEVAYLGAHTTLTLQSWWRARPGVGSTSRPTPQRRAEVAHRLRAHLERGALALDEPGSWLALSGGLDSATLLGLSPHPAKTRTLTLDLDPGERRRARALAEAMGARWEPLPIETRWPLRLPAQHLSAAGWGPHAHPDLGWFSDALSQLRSRLNEPLLTLVTGHGADDALWIPPRVWLDDRFEHLAPRDLLAAARHLGLSRLSAPALGAALQRLGLRAAREHLRPAPAPTPPWLLCPPYASPAGIEPASRRFARFRAARQHTWNWELIMRSLARIARQANLRLLTPFLDAEVWDLSLELSPAELVEGGRQKAPLRRLGRHLPSEVRRRPKLGSFDALVERGLADKELNRALRLMTHSQLARHRVIHEAIFQKALADYLARPLSGPPWRGSWEIWRTLAAELWLQNQSRWAAADVT
ncbi:asparagine synthase-related protein [Lujinxingia vulgaris]|uniref:asparagine synthase-related protein n=1 Tax=Lujinxingia vulgaris TaxID=2600176 RepID=UPI001E4B2CC0|nr:asparagine synthase-related protein [Lujinxingia vulgaris]